MTPSTSSFSHSAVSAISAALATEMTVTATARHGSALKAMAASSRAARTFSVMAIEARRLQREHLRVAPAARHQRGMVAVLDDPPALEHDDAIRVADGREAMRDEQGRRAARGVEEG